MNTEQQKFMKMKIDINIHVKYTRNSLGFFVCGYLVACCSLMKITLLKTYLVDLQFNKKPTLQQILYLKQTYPRHLIISTTFTSFKTIQDFVIYFPFYLQPDLKNYNLG